jgi:hypothetical protein
MSESTNQIIIIFIIAIVAAGVWYYMKKNKESTDTSGNNPPIQTDSIEIVQENSNASFYPTFVTGTDTKIRYNSPDFSYNPASGTLSANTFKGRLQGSVSNIDVGNIPDVNIQNKIEGYHQTGYYGIERYSEQPMRNSNSGRVRGAVVGPEAQYFVPLVSATGANQTLNATNKLKYDPTTQTLTAKANFANNITSDTNQKFGVPYQSDVNTTVFAVPNANLENQVLYSDGAQVYWSDLNDIPIGNANTVFINEISSP